MSFIPIYSKKYQENQKPQIIQPLQQSQKTNYQQQQQIQQQQQQFQYQQLPQQNLTQTQFSFQPNQSTLNQQTSQIQLSVPQRIPQNNNFIQQYQQQPQRILSPRQQNKFQKPNDIYQLSPNSDMHIKRYYGRNSDENLQNNRVLSPKINRISPKKSLFQMNVNSISDTIKRDQQRVISPMKTFEKYQGNYNQNRTQSTFNGRSQYLQNNDNYLNKSNVRVLSPKTINNQNSFYSRVQFSPKNLMNKSVISPIKSQYNLNKVNDNKNMNNSIRDSINVPIYNLPRSPLKYDPSKRSDNFSQQNQEHEKWRNEFISNDYKFKQLDTQENQQLQKQQPLFQSSIRNDNNKNYLPQDLVIDNRGKLDNYQDLFPVENKNFPQKQQQDIKQSQMSTATPFNFAKFESQTQALSSFAFIGNLDIYKSQENSPGSQSRRQDSVMDNSQFYQSYGGNTSKRYYQNANELKKEIKKENSIFEQPLEKFQSKYPLEHYSNQKQIDKANFKLSSALDPNYDIKNLFSPPILYENQSLKYVSWSSWADKPGKPEFHEEFVFTQKEISIYEQQLNSLRIQLIGRPDFNIYTLFKYFDIDGVHDIDYQELMYGFEKFGIKAKPLHMFLLIIRYSRDGDFEISIEEFKRLFYPQQVMEQNQEQLNINQDVKIFSQETNQIITQIMKMLLNEEDAAEFYRNYLKDNNIDLKKIFHKITNTPEFEENAQLTRYQYADSLLYNGFYLKDQEVRMIFNRFDRQEKGYVNWKEFIFELTPQDYLFKKYKDLLRNQNNSQKQKKIKPKFVKQPDINKQNDLMSNQSNNQKQNNPFLSNSPSTQQPQQHNQQQQMQQNDVQQSQQYQQQNEQQLQQNQLYQQQNLNPNQQEDQQQSSSLQQQKTKKNIQFQNIQFQNNFLQGNQKQQQNINQTQHNQQHQQVDQSQKALLEAQQQQQMQQQQQIEQQEKQKLKEQRKKEKQLLKEQQKQIELQKQKQLEEEQQEQEQYELKQQQILYEKQQELIRQKELQEQQQHLQSQKFMQQKEKEKGGFSQEWNHDEQQQNNEFQNNDDEFSQQGREYQQNNQKEFGDFDQNDFGNFESNDANNNKNDDFGNFNGF